MADEITSSLASSNVSFNNAHHFITIKLSPTNYLFWKTQITLFLKAQNLLGYVDVTHQCPHPMDPGYHLWLQQDTLIMSLLIGSLSEDVFPKVIGLETSHEIWTSLEKAFASPSNINTDQSVQQAGDQSVTGQMDPVLYKSAKYGEIDVLKRQNKDQLHVELTASGNTLLHVLATFHDSAECVDAILKMQSSTIKQSMLMWKNSKGETALHIAANNGRSNIVRALIEHAKPLEELESGAKIAEEMMRVTDQNGDTALHRAVRNKHAKVVELLVEEDPDFPHSSNRMEETPLYLAVETFDLDIVDSILTACKSVAYAGPGGQTALHAAAIFNWRGCISRLLRKNQALTKEVDEFGWSPLHYAARFNRLSSATKLLQADRSAAYIVADKDDNRTPLHVAACFNSVDVMKVLLKHCPDCWEMTTSKGQNVAHLAVGYERREALEFILDHHNSWATHLINEKDDEGNTPLHLYATSYDLFGRRLVTHLGANTNALNKQNLTPLDMITNLKHFSRHEDSIKKELRRKGGQLGYRNVIQRDRNWYSELKEFINNDEKKVPKDIRKQGDTHLIVAALIATVTFAAGFTLPGSYDGDEGPNQGMPLLARKATFNAFIVSDTIALMSSILAVFLHFVASIYVDQRKVVNRYVSAFVLIIIATIAMSVAFIAGLYTVLAPSSLGLAISICLFGSLSILSFFGVFYRIVQDDY